MSTRTPIRFGAIMEAVFAERLSRYERVLTETTSQYLLYGYRRYLVGDCQGFILIQAARGAGRVAFELGISRVDSFPYHRLRDFPSVGMAGFRESLGYLQKGYDYAEEYQNQESLVRVLTTMARDLEANMSRLAERSLPRINAAYKAWQPHYADWVKAEQTATGTVPQRYSALPGEGMAYELLDDLLGKGGFDRYLGPLKYRYRQQDFFNCHLFLLARGLEFLEPPPLENPQPAQAAQIPEGVCPPLDDPIAALTGRLPHAMAVDLAVSTSVRLTEFAFLHSLSAVEALLQFDSRGMPCTSEEESLPIESFVLETPSFAAADLVDAPEYAAPLIETISAPPPPKAAPPPATAKPRPKRVADDDDDDPMSALENRLGLR